MEHGASRLLHLIAFVRIRVLLFLGAVFPDIALVRLSGYGSHIAFIAQMAALFASSLHPHLVLRFRHAVCCCFRVHLAVVLASYDGVIDGFGSRLSSFDTPMERWISNGSRVVHVARVARIAIVL